MVQNHVQRELKSLCKVESEQKDTPEITREHEITEMESLSEFEAFSRPQKATSITLRKKAT